MDKQHILRVKRELLEVGITGYALHRAEGRYLPQIIHENEHIKAAVYGRTDVGSAILVATDHRIIYLDKKPLMAICDEISYEVIAGVGIGRESGLFASVTLYTRMGNYSVRFVNPTAARRFDRFLGKVRLEGSPQPDSRRTKPIEKVKAPGSVLAPKRALMDAAVERFLDDHELAVLSTLNRTGQLHGSAVYYVRLPETANIYILTKSETSKAHNIMATHQIALTVYDEQNLQTVQLSGTAEIEADLTIKQKVFDRINVVRQYGDEQHHAPVTKLTNGSFMVFRIAPTSAVFSDFRPKN